MQTTQATPVLVEWLVGLGLGLFEVAYTFLLFRYKIGRARYETSVRHKQPGAALTDLARTCAAHDGQGHPLSRGEGGGMTLEGGLEQRVQLHVAVGVDDGNRGTQTRLSRAR